MIRDRLRTRQKLTFVVNLNMDIVIDFLLPILLAGSSGWSPNVVRRWPHIVQLTEVIDRRFFRKDSHRTGHKQADNKASKCANHIETVHGRGGEFHTILPSVLFSNRIIATTSLLHKIPASAVTSGFEVQGEIDHESDDSFF